ncbi:hypothetical protein D3C81_1887180 [compost metagenome]
MHFFYARHFILDGIAGQLMNQLPEGGILLRWTAYDSKGEDRPFFGIDLMYLHHRKRMDQAVVP